MRKAHLLGICLLVGVWGCGGEESVDVAAPAPAPDTQAAQTPQAPAVEPEYAVTIRESETEPKQYTVEWTVTVPTGGWTMTTERVLVEESMGKTEARIYAILEQPAASEMVTQAIQTLTGTHDAGTQAVDKAELSIKRQTRGATHEFPMYSVVRRSER